MRKRWSAGGFVLAMLLTAAIRADETKADQPEPGFTSLFNGKSLDGWHIMNNGRFSVKDGVIFLNKGRGWLRSDKEYKDFELRLDFRFLNPRADSGIFVRSSKEGKDWPAMNYQVQLIDATSMGNLFVAGGLAKPKVIRDAEKVKKVMKPVGEWQSYVIIAQGPRLEVRLNGEVITVAEGLADQPGYLGLQGEGGQLEFKNIRLKELKAGK